MPNWITNILEFNQKDIHSEFKNFLKGDRNLNEVIDFNKLIVQPTIMDVMNDDDYNRLAMCAYISHLMVIEKETNPVQIILNHSDKKALESPVLKVFLKHYMLERFLEVSKTGKQIPEYKDYFIDKIILLINAHNEKDKKDNRTESIDSMICNHGIINKWVLDFLKEENLTDAEIGELKPITRESILDLGKFYFDNFVKYGCFDWYNWRVNNWGTKWNACHSKWHNDYTLVFDTAWAPPIPIMEEIKRRFSYMQISHYFVDEGNPFQSELWYTDKYNSGFIDKTGTINQKQLTTHIYSIRDNTHYSVDDIFSDYDEDDDE